MHPFFILIPGNGTTRIASLIPFQGVAQHSRHRPDTEVVRGEWAEYQTATHGKAVQVARDVYRSHGHLLAGKIITRRIVDVPSATDLHITAGVQRVGKRIRIAHSLLIELFLTLVFADAIAIAQVQ